MSRLPPPSPGPIETNEFADRLVARVVAPGLRPRLHGYDVRADLARHYGFADVVFLAATGELPPTASVARAFEACLVSLSPAPVAEAPTHLAVITRLCGGPTPGVLGTGAVGLAQQANDVVTRHAALLAWLDHPQGPLPGCAFARDDDERDAGLAISAAAESAGIPSPLGGYAVGPDAAALAVFHSCGLRAPHQLATVYLVARLPALAAEAFAASPADLRRYPIDLPRYSYEDPE
jgi:hypothetical protein